MLSDVTTPQDLDENLRSQLQGLTATEGYRPDASQPVRDGTTLTGDLTRQILEAQLASRHLDLAARWLRGFDAGFYTVGSSGHEGNAAVAAALRSTDPALLHTRSGAFYCARAAQVAGTDAIRDVLRGLAASAKEPMTGGRGKVFGSRSLNIIPTTGMGAAHLPRAVGMAYTLGRGRPLDVVDASVDWPPDAIVVCSFGDAAVNHATATAAINAAGWLERSGLRLPLLLICEDNGLGLSVRSPEGWVADTLRFRPGLRYFAADGLDVVAAHDEADRAVTWVRKHRRPAVLHLTTVRLLGHCDDDLEGAHRTPGEVSADIARDPVVATARLLVESGFATAEELIARYDEIGWRVRRTAEESLAEPKLGSATEIVASLAPRRPVGVSRAVAEASTAVLTEEADRSIVFDDQPPEDTGPLTLAQTIRAALLDGLVAHPNMLVFGQDVAAKGGPYGVTRGLREQFGKTRVFDTLFDEISVVGLALGSGLAGMLPVAEVQCLSYLHSAEGQLRGEGAMLQFLSQGAYRNPMVLRVPGLAHQLDLGGHIRNDNTLAVLRDVPGVIVAVPARAEDAAPMLRTCLAAAEVDGSVSVIVEPIALYETRDLYAEGDGFWMSSYAPPADWSGVHVPIGKARVYPEGTGRDLTIVTFGSGVRMALRVARRLAEQDGVGSRVVDLRWLSPLPLADIMRESSATGRVLIVDETRRSGGIGEGVLAVLVDAGYVGAARRIAAVDSFVPLGPAAEHVLVSEEQIVQGARSLLAH
ncbi:MAG: MFS transporter [Dactylosporangium sp.]|nr:MFS transporter [Dactylosporangium sp.]NNJ59894.1 MFS transporter [Dactylosporangium sp.]